MKANSDPWKTTPIYSFYDANTLEVSHHTDSLVVINHHLLAKNWQFTSMPYKVTSTPYKVNLKQNSIKYEGKFWST